MAFAKVITLTECPTGVGATFHGLSRGPASLIAAGIVQKLEGVGYKVTRRIPFEPVEGTIAVDDSTDDSTSLNGVRDENLAVEINRKLKNDILDSLSSARDRRSFQLFLGGVCTLCPAIVSALMEAWPERRVGIIWFDADADLSLPKEYPGSTKVLATMAFSQMTMREGALQSMQEFSTPDKKGVSTPENTVFFGLNTTHPSVVPRDHLTYLIDNHYRIFSSKSVSQSIQAARSAAKQALQHLAVNGCKTIVVHVDVDVIDGQNFPLGNLPNFTGISFQQFVAALEVFVTDESVCCVNLTEMNPDRDTGLVMTTRLVDEVVSSFRKRAGSL